MHVECFQGSSVRSGTYPVFRLVHLVFHLVELEFLAKLKAAPDFGQKTCTFQKFVTGHFQ